MPHVELPQAEFKAVILGDSHIGKTSLVTRFAEGYYRENSRPATVGGYFVTRTIPSSDGIMTKVQIWDTAGAESFRAMAPVFYGKANAIIVCYDATRRSTYDGMRGWLDEVRGRVGADRRDVVIAIAALKTDLLRLNDYDVDRGGGGGGGSGGGGAVEKVAVPEYEAEQLAEALGFIYLPTSAKTGHNVHALFQKVADRVLQYRAANPRLTNGDASDSTDGKKKRLGADVGSNRAKINHPGNDGSYTTGSTMNHGMAPYITPRKGDPYIGTNGDANDARNRNEATNDKDHTTAHEKSRGSNAKNNNGRYYRTNSRSGTPSTKSGTIATDIDGSVDEDAFMVHATPNDKTRRGGDESRLLCANGDYACTPTCGVIDGGGSSCIVQ